MEQVKPYTGDIESAVDTTGTVYPCNRLEVIPLVAGRVEKMLVVEGQYVRKGQILAWMSSSERAALIDAARAQGGEAVTYWENAYKPIPLVAPITGMVIVRGVEPGQSVTTSSIPIVLADRLVVNATVDETDMGRIRIGQPAEITLDAHPEVSVKGKVTHIAYESTVTNNVTMYKVEITPVKIPEVFRSGMSANIKVLVQSRKNVILIPLTAVMTDKSGSYVLVARPDKKQGERRTVQLGLSNTLQAEVVSGIELSDILLIPQKAATAVKSASGKKTGDDSASASKKNPFMPTPPKGRR